MVRPVIYSPCLPYLGRTGARSLTDDTERDRCLESAAIPPGRRGMVHEPANAGLRLDAGRGFRASGAGQERRAEYEDTCVLQHVSLPWDTSKSPTDGIRYVVYGQKPKS